MSSTASAAVLSHTIHVKAAGWMAVKKAVGEVDVTRRAALAGRAAPAARARMGVGDFCLLRQLVHLSRLGRHRRRDRGPGSTRDVGAAHAVLLTLLCRAEHLHGPAARDVQ